jgi:O-antigen/teichoic acid export membrane protein
MRASHAGLFRRTFRQLASNAVMQLALVRGLGALMQFAAVGAIVALYAPGRVGIYAVLNTVWLLVRQLGPLGLDQVNLKYLGGQRLDPTVQEAVASWTQKRVLRISAIAGFSGVALGAFVGGASGLSLVIGSIGLPIYALQGVWASELRGRGRIILGQVPESLLLPAVTVIVAGAGSSHMPTWGAVIAAFTGGAATTVMLAWLIRRERHASGPRSAGVDPIAVGLVSELSRMGRSAGLGQVGIAVTVRAPTIIVGSIGGLVAAAAYEVAARVQAVPTLLTSSAGTVSSPIFARAADAGDRKLILRTWLQNGMIAGTASLLILSIIAVWGPRLLEALDPVYVSAYVPMLLLLGAATVNGFLSLASNYLLMSGAERQVAVSNWVAGGSTLAGSAIVADAFGASGVALVAATAMVSRDVALSIIAVRHLKS